MADNAGNSKKTAENKKVPGRPFQPGKSGNPSGRPKMPNDIKEALNKLTPMATKRLEEMVSNPDTDYKVLIQVINTIYDRVYGKPQQYVDQTNNGEIKIILEGSLTDYGS